MTREEAIYFANCLKNNYTVNLNDMEAFCDEAIKALEQGPLDGDYVSREKVKEILRSGVSLDLDEDKDYVCDLIDKLPSESEDS